MKFSSQSRADQREPFGRGMKERLRTSDRTEGLIMNPIKNGTIPDWNESVGEQHQNKY